VQVASLPIISTLNRERGDVWGRQPFWKNEQSSGNGQPGAIFPLTISALR
jgi:hypothetical protein